MDYVSDPYQVFQDDLRPGERLLWTGQPNPSRLLSAGDVIMIPFSLMWGGFAFFWEFMAIKLNLKGGTGPGIIMPIFGLPFCAIGFYLIFGRFIFLANQRKRTYYGVTDQRALFVTLGRQRSSQYVTFDRQLNVQKSIRGDGSGSIIFGNSQMPTWAVSMMARNQNTAAQIPTFAEIKDAAEVAALIDKQLAALPSVPASAPAGA